MSSNQKMLPTAADWADPTVKARIESAIRAELNAGAVVAISPEEWIAEASLPGRNFLLARGDLYAEVNDRFGIGWVKVAG